MIKWNEHLGIGTLDVNIKETQYDRAYWEKYVSYRTNPIGEKLMKARADLVGKYTLDGIVVDIGIGSGHFIDTRSGKTFGYDVNPVAIRWLLDRDLWWDPYFRNPGIVTCWDSLEHMSRPEALVRCVSGMIFVSIPIFTDLKHVMRSKHYRPDEHFWYFTRDGLVGWMGRHGFGLLEENWIETDLGREDIGTFVFKRTESFL
jgi:hypothetical protein